MLQSNYRRWIELVFIVPSLVAFAPLLLAGCAALFIGTISNPLMLVVALIVGPIFALPVVGFYMLVRVIISGPEQYIQTDLSRWKFIITGSLCCILAVGIFFSSLSVLSVTSLLVLPVIIIGSRYIWLVGTKRIASKNS